MIGIAILLLVVLIAISLKPKKEKRLEALLSSIEQLEKNQEKIEKSVKEEISKNREENTHLARSNREELNNSIESFSKRSSENLEKIRETVEENLRRLQEDNNQKLEKMRETVDEKLHSTLEKRLGDSFKLVSERLELVHKGLGEMQSLASGVGDLKRVLSNIKTRGTWGEVQLGNILEQTLSPEQYEKNVGTKANSSERVDYAIKLPGKNNGSSEHVWLPIDAKFPQEDYQRLQDAHENADHELALEATKLLENRIKLEAKNVKEKYLSPPQTTDFAIIFLPVEGLYAEVLRIPGLAEKIQKEHRVIISGPTTLTALLNSLQMGFRTLAIEQRSSEVWSLLAAVKSEFGKFGDILEKTQKKLQEASNTIDTAARKSRTIERKLKTVEQLPAEEESKALFIE